MGRHQNGNPQLAARAGDLSIAASGSVAFDGALALTGTATFSREKSQELIRRVHELSGARNERGEIELPVNASGTMASPQFSINMAKILGRAAQKELERQIKRRLLGIIKK
ncbi:MAG: hypothetical protein EHM13_00115 [Acidobacteria bacterium]|nr:MAG: hypothetical protein EHM13_00115 [Acidobacteriota bacterium]